MTIFGKIDKSLKTISRWFGWIGSLTIVAMTALIVYDVFRRYILNDPMLGTHEIVSYMLLVCFFFFITDCWNVSTHVRMGIFYEKMRGRLKRTADAIVGVMGALFFAAMAMKIWDELIYAIEAGLVSTELLMPIWPFKLIALVCLILFVLQLLISTVIPPGMAGHGRSEK